MCISLVNRTFYESAKCRIFDRSTLVQKDLNKVLQVVVEEIDLLIARELISLHRLDILLLVVHFEERLHVVRGQKSLIVIG